MTVKEALTAKVYLEKSIYELITKFETESGLHVDSISIHKASLNNGIKYLTKVDIEAKLH